jgi:hypothetical protein
VPFRLIPDAYGYPDGHIIECVLYDKIFSNQDPNGDDVFGIQEKVYKIISEKNPEDGNLIRLMVTKTSELYKKADRVTFTNPEGDDNNNRKNQNPL